MSVESTNSLPASLAASIPATLFVIPSDCCKAQALVESKTRSLNSGPFISQTFSGSQTTLQQAFYLSPLAQLITPAKAESDSSAILPALAEKFVSLVERFVGVFEQAVEFFIKRENEKKAAAAAEAAVAPSNSSSIAAESDYKSTPAEAKRSGSSAGPQRGEPLQTGRNFFYRPQYGKSKVAQVLLPKELLGQVANVKILSPDYKKVLDEAKPDGVTVAKRSRYKFTKNGSTLPRGAILQIKLKSGELKDVLLGDTSKSQRK